LDLGRKGKIYNIEYLKSENPSIILDKWCINFYIIKYYYKYPQNFLLLINKFINLHYIIKKLLNKTFNIYETLFIVDKNSKIRSKKRKNLIIGTIFPYFWVKSNFDKI